MNPRTWLAALVLSLVGLAAGGCAYSTGALVPDRYTTIAVPVFENETRRHDLEWALTRAVVEEIQARTHLRVVDPGDDPDLVLRGSLVKVQEDVLSGRRYERVRESSVVLTADVEVTERGGPVYLARRPFTERESFTAVVSEDLRTAREEAVRALAERIVHGLEGDW